MGLEPTIYRLEVCRLIQLGHEGKKVPRRFELRFADSKSAVLTNYTIGPYHYNYNEPSTGI